MAELLATVESMVAGLKGWLSRWAGVVCGSLLLLAGATVLVIWNDQSIRILGVGSDSMAPLVRKGDAVIAYKVNPLVIQKGDLVSYRSPKDSTVIITHRVIETDPLTGRLITKGDANVEVDPTIHSARVIGRVQYLLPGAGRYINALHSWTGLILAVYLPTAILLMSELRRLARHYLQPTYVLHRPSTR